MDKEGIEKLKLMPIDLSDKGWSSLIKILEKPSGPNKALKKAFQEHSKIVTK